MKKEFVMRGKLAHGISEILNFSGYKKGYAYRLVEFDLWPSTSVAGSTDEQLATLTAGKTAVDPINPDYNDEGLIGTAMFVSNGAPTVTPGSLSLINDTFPITQDLIILARDESGGNDINYQARFESFKMTGPEEATANYNQFTIFDE